MLICKPNTIQYLILKQTYRCSHRRKIAGSSRDPRSLVRPATRTTQRKLWDAAAILLVCGRGSWWIACDLNELMYQVSHHHPIFKYFLLTGIRPHVQTFSLENTASLVIRAKPSRSQAQLTAPSGMWTITYGYNSERGLAQSRCSSTSGSRFSRFLVLFAF